LANAGKLNTDVLKGGWERYKMQTIDAPFIGVKQALVIAGSDRRGTAYGVFDLSKAIGVSPLYWWADVVPSKKESLVVSPMEYVSKEPTVQYRGIFINDEDFGIQSWANNTFDPVKDIGPKTYEKVCELLLRLKANYLWPAMHTCTKAFNLYAENKIVADNYAIVMGSSHHEPMLYNTHEWPYPTSEWNPFTNMDKVMGELEKRVKSNGSYENLFTMGIRGTEDGPMAGGSTLNEKTAKLEEVITRERGLLSSNINSDLRKVPQIFFPYKEVTDIYNNNMVLPEDITLGWVDDNFGYVRQVSNLAEQARSGGSGVYYHISYWGDPSDYLWIASTPPALIASEMKKAASFGGNRVWVFNVGDIKPAEMLTSYCLDLAFDYNKWGTDNVREYLMEWSASTFGEAFSQDITNAYMTYFQLAQAGKPEHLNLVKFSATEMEQRLATCQELSKSVELVYAQIPAELKDAFFETVYYPIICGGLMNEKFIYANKSFRGALNKDPNALVYSQKSRDALYAITANTSRYNTVIQGGKWNKMISSSPRSQAVYNMPAVASKTDVDKVHTEMPGISLASGSYVLPMKFEKGVVYGEKVGKQTIATGGSAKYTFEMTKSAAAELYFYVKTPSPEEDSWYINVNGAALVQNDYGTGRDFEWLKIWSGTLPLGLNSITINQREPNAVIGAIKIVEPGVMPYTANYVPEPDTVIPAWKFSTRQNAQGFQWEAVEGLTTSEKGMINTPFTLPSVAQVKDAPYLEQIVDVTDSVFTLEVRCTPTKKLYEGRDLRIGISINEEEPKVYSIHEPYPTTAWGKNVLRGYIKTLVNCTTSSPSVKIRLYALDPGVIFDQVLIYNASGKGGGSTGISSALDFKSKVLAFPNPCKDYLTISLDKYVNEEVKLELTDLKGVSLISRKVRVGKSLEQLKLPVSGLVDGTYLLNVRSEKGVSSFKVVKRK